MEDGEPRAVTINSMRVLKKKLDLLYNSKLRRQSTELFLRKTDEANTLPEYGAVKAVIDRIEGEVPVFLSSMEKNLEPECVVMVSSEPGCSGIQKMMSAWWRKTCCELAVLVLWLSKHRSGVVSDMTVDEWSSRKYEADKTIVVVAKHKTGDKEPALIVLPPNINRMMERYYDLRRRVQTDNNYFFITNKGKRLVKIYDEINKIYGSRLSANIFRRMVESMARAHDHQTSSGVAKALQHSEDTALRYYQVPDANEALRRQSTLDTVDQTAAFEVALLNEFDDLFPAEPFSCLNEQFAMEKILSSDPYSAHPTAKVSSAFVQKICSMFNRNVTDARVDVMTEMLKRDYDANNISRIAVVDCAKSNRVHYFLNYKKDKFIKNVMSNIKKCIKP